ncbi:unnamed protein product, partial [marine sediment metagenome]
LVSGQRTAGLALSSDIVFDGRSATGTAKFVLGALPDGLLILPAGDVWLLVDATTSGVTVTPLEATDFSRPLARVECSGAAATVIGAPVADLAVTVLAAEAAGLARWQLQTAADYAKVREQFGKPIGSFQAVKHMCAEMLLRSQQVAVAASDVAEAAVEAAAGGDRTQLSIAAAVAAAAAIDAAKHNGRDCIQVLGGIGFTWEHDAHLYLRRAYATAQILGGHGSWLRRVAALTRSGLRRQLH